MAFLRTIILLALALATPALAAEAVYPPGSRVGLAPPPGVLPSRSFVGFEDGPNNVAVILLGLPAEAYGEVVKSTATETLKKQGVIVEKREAMSLSGGKGFLVIGRQEVEKMRLRKWIAAAPTGDLTALVTVQIPDAARRAYPDAVVRAAIASLTVRKTVPVEEQLGLLPFRLSELAGFRVGGVMGGRAVMLTDTAVDAPGDAVDPHMVVAIAPGGPAQTGDRENFAHNLFRSIPNLRDVRVETSESLRIAGQGGHQIVANGKDHATGNPITIVQWLRFGGGAFLHVVGVARTDVWTPAYARFRSVRDGIEPR
jgi:hypothetical protein